MSGANQLVNDTTVTSIGNNLQVTIEVGLVWKRGVRLKNVVTFVGWLRRAYSNSAYDRRWPPGIVLQIAVVGEST